MGVERPFFTGENMVQRYVKLDKTKQSVLTTSDFFSASNVPDRIVCVSERDYVTLRSFIFPHCLWDTRFGSWIDDNLFHVASNEEFRQLVDHIQELDYRLGAIAMASCSDAIQTGLQAIANAIAGQTYSVSQTQTQQQDCGCGGALVEVNNFVQGLTPSGQTMYGSNPPGEGEGETGLPPGWESEVEYRLHKCQAANLIVDGLILSMQALAALDIALLIQGGIAASLIFGALAVGITVPVVAAPILIAALIALGLSLGALQDVSDYWQTHRNSIVCSLFQSADVAAATQAVEEWIDEALAGAAISAPLHPAIKTIALLLASTDTLDQLFDLTLAVTYPDANCDECGTSDWVVDAGMPTPALPYATVTDLGENRFRIDSGAVYNWTYPANSWYCNFAIYLADGVTPARVWFTDVEFVSSGGTNVVLVRYNDSGQEPIGSWQNAAYVETWLEGRTALGGYKHGYISAEQQFTITFTLVQADT